MTNDRYFLWRNFHGVVSTRPPPVICALFLGVFALGCFALGYYVQHNNIVDADATKGWNHLYSNLSSLAFCLNGTTAEKHYNNMDIPNYGRDYEMVNISLPFELTARPYPGSLPLNTTDLVGLIPFYNFKFGRNFVHENPVWISIQSDVLFGHCIMEEDQASPRCREMTYPTCVTVLLPSAILPLVKPRSCNYTSPTPRAAKMSVMGLKQQTEDTDKSICEGQIELSLTKQRGYDTRVLLSLAEKTKLNLRLQLASYFLFVILLSLILFAAIRGKSYKHLKKNDETFQQDVNKYYQEIFIF